MVTRLLRSGKDARVRASATMTTNRVKHEPIDLPERRQGGIPFSNVIGSVSTTLPPTNPFTSGRFHPGNTLDQMTWTMTMTMTMTMTCDCRPRSWHRKQFPPFAPSVIAVPPAPPMLNYGPGAPFQPLLTNPTRHSHTWLPNRKCRTACQAPSLNMSNDGYSEWVAISVSNGRTWSNVPTKPFRLSDCSRLHDLQRLRLFGML